MRNNEDSLFAIKLKDIMYIPDVPAKSTTALLQSTPKCVPAESLFVWIWGRTYLYNLSLSRPFDLSLNEPGQARKFFLFVRLLSG